MAQFRGILNGGRGSVTRLGHKTTGMSATVNGWHSGARINAGHDEQGDYFDVSMTGGSKGGGSERIARIRDGGHIEILIDRRREFGASL